MKSLRVLVTGRDDLGGDSKLKFEEGVDSFLICRIATRTIT